VRKITAIIFCVFLSYSLIFSQTSNKETTAIKIGTPINIDGLLDEPVWNNVPNAIDFLQIHSDRDNPEVVSTTVKILYDNKFLYLSFYCYDSEPEKIFADIRERDKDIRLDDSAYVLISAGFDLNNFYYFGTNLLGAQFDGKISRDVLTVVSQWNGKWEAVGRRGDFGWCAEIAIDLSCLGYRPDENISLGLSLSRVVPRLDSIFQKGPLDPAFKVEEIGDLKMLELKRSIKKVELVTHLITTRETDEKFMQGAGLDFSYSFNQMTSARTVINPEFVTVEPDNEMVNLSAYELYIPEKRNFFKERPGGNQQKFGLFYSKRIGDIEGGVSLQGKSGSFEYSGMSVISDKDESNDGSRANYSTFNLKKEFSNSSFLSLTASNKREGGKNYGAAGIDAGIFFSNKFKLSGRFAASYGDYKDNFAFSVGPVYDSDTFHAHLNYIQLGEHFGENVNHIGFIPDDNRKEIDSALVKKFVFQGGSFDYIRYKSNYDIFWGMDDALRGWKIDQSLYLNFRSGWEIGIEHTQEFRLNEDIRGPVLTCGWEPGDYPTTSVNHWWRYFEDFKNHRTKLSSGMDKGNGNLFKLTFSTGENFGLTFWMMEMIKSNRINQGLIIEFYFCSLKYDSNPDLMFRSTSIAMIKTDYLMAKNLHLKGFVQINTAIKKTNVQFLCNYTILPPFASVQFGYQIGDPWFGVAVNKNQQVFLKLSGSF
jgi:hypothetical protein